MQVVIDGDDLDVRVGSVLHALLYFGVKAVVLRADERLGAPGEGQTWTCCLWDPALDVKGVVRERLHSQWPGRAALGLGHRTLRNSDQVAGPAGPSALICGQNRGQAVPACVR